MIISPDSHLYVDDNYVWNPEAVKEAWAIARKEFAGFLQHCEGVKRLGLALPKVFLMVGAPASGKSTWLRSRGSAFSSEAYFDACFDLPWKRQPFIDQARAMGCEVVVVWIDTPLEICIARNGARSKDRQVPEKVVRAMWEKINNEPPASGEGVLVWRWKWNPNTQQYDK